MRSRLARRSQQSGKDHEFGFVPCYFERAIPAKTDLVGQMLLMACDTHKVANLETGKFVLRLGKSASFSGSLGVGKFDIDIVDVLGQL